MDKNEINDLKKKYKKITGKELVPVSVEQLQHEHPINGITIGNILDSLRSLNNRVTELESKFTGRRRLIDKRDSIN
jgi:hypothetical protein